MPDAAEQEQRALAVGASMLARLVDHPEESGACLQKVLTIDPSHAAAQEGLK